MAAKGKRVEAVGYMRTSSATNVGEGKDSQKRQRAAIEGYAKSAGYVIVDWYYDAAVKGADPVTARPGFAAMLERIAEMASARSLSRARIGLRATLRCSLRATTTSKGSAWR